MSERTIQLEKHRISLYKQRKNAECTLILLQEQEPSLLRVRRIREAKEDLAAIEQSLVWVQNEFDRLKIFGMRSERKAESYRAERAMLKTMIKNLSTDPITMLKTSVSDEVQTEILNCYQRIKAIDRKLARLVCKQEQREPRVKLSASQKRDKKFASPQNEPRVIQTTQTSQTEFDRAFMDVMLKRELIKKGTTV